MNIDNQIVLECAFRYALGRSTYVTEAVSNIMIDCWDALPKSKRIKFISEIRKASEENKIGMEMDKNVWWRLVLLEEATEDNAKMKNNGWGRSYGYGVKDNAKKNQEVKND